LDLINIDKTLI